MGLIRKTLSVSTLGLVAFRSTKEQLGRADRARRQAEKALDAEHSKRLTAEKRITAAEGRVQRATDAKERAAHRLEQSKRRDRRAKRVRALVADTEPTRKRAHKAATRKAHDAKRGAARSVRRSKRAAATTKDNVGPQIDRAVARAAEAVEHLSS